MGLLTLYAFGTAVAQSDRILPSVSARVTPEDLVRAAGLPADAELEAAGAVIGDIEVRITNVFDTRRPEEDTRLFRLANRLHIQTRERTVRTQLLIRSGERYSARVLAESERLLRRVRYLRSATVVPRAYHDGRVDILVVTQDVWTLNPGISFGRSGGRNTSGFEIEELNLFGLGSQLSLGYSSGIDRDSKTIAFADQQLFGTWWAGSARYSDNSDGKTSALTLDHPFFALGTRWAGGVSALSEERIDLQYDLGHVVNEFSTRERVANAYVGWSTGLQSGWVNRLRFGWAYDRREFSALTTTRYRTLPPPDRELAYPWIGWQLAQDDYRVTRNRDLIERVEDLYLGWNVYATLGKAQPAFGADRVSTIFTAGVSKGFTPTPRQILLWNLSTTGRYERGEFADAVTSVAAKYYWRQSDHRTFYTAVSADAASNLDTDHQLLLGGDNGLRGYPLRYQGGEGRWLFTAEQRFYTNWFPFRLVNVGAAVFTDIGATWGANPIGTRSLGVLKDVGFGLRLGNTRSALGNVLHLDIAFPLDGDASIQNMQFLVQTKATF